MVKLDKIIDFTLWVTLVCDFNFEGIISVSSSLVCMCENDSVHVGSEVLNDLMTSLRRERESFFTKKKGQQQ